MIECVTPQCTREGFAALGNLCTLCYGETINPTQYGRNTDNELPEVSHPVDVVIYPLEELELKQKITGSISNTMIRDATCANCTKPVLSPLTRCGYCGKDVYPTTSAARLAHTETLPAVLQQGPAPFAAPSSALLYAEGTTRAPPGQSDAGYNNKCNIFGAYSTALHGTPRFGGWYETLSLKKFADEAHPLPKVPVRKLVKHLATIGRKNKLRSHDDDHWDQAVAVYIAVSADDGAHWKWYCTNEDVGGKSCVQQPNGIVLATDDGGGTWSCSPLRHTPNASIIHTMEEEDMKTEGSSEVGFEPRTPRSPSNDEDDSSAMDDWKKAGGGDLSTSIWAAVDLRPDAKDESKEEDDEDKPPFHGLKYPTLVMGQTNFIAITKAGLHADFTRNKIHFLGTLILSIGLLALSIALLILRMDTSDTCCSTRPGTCSWDKAGFLNLTRTTNFTYLSLPECEAGCARLELQGQRAFLYGASSQYGVLSVMLIVGSFTSIILSLGVNFFHMRSLAQGLKKEGKFWKAVLIFQIFVSLALMALTTLVFVKLYHQGRVQPIKCSYFGDMDSSICTSLKLHCDGLALEGYITNLSHVQPIEISLMCLAGLLVLCSLIPPSPSEEVLEELPRVIPDTHIFRPGPYIPAGPTQEQREELSDELDREWKRPIKKPKPHAALDGLKRYNSVKKMPRSLGRDKGATFYASSRAPGTTETIGYVVQSDGLPAQPPLLPSVKAMVEDVAYRVNSQPNRVRAPTPSQVRATPFQEKSKTIDYPGAVPSKTVGFGGTAFSTTPAQPSGNAPATIRPYSADVVDEIASRISQRRQGKLVV